MERGAFVNIKALRELEMVGLPKVQFMDLKVRISVSCLFTFISCLFTTSGDLGQLRWDPREGRRGGQGRAARRPPLPGLHPEAH